MRIFIFFILIIFTNYLLSQQVMQFYGLGKSDVISSMAKPIDGGLIFAGSTTTFSSGGSDLWVMKSDDSLNFEWQRNFGNASDEFGREIFLNKDEIIIIGQRIYKSSSAIWILAMNHKGEKIWDNVVNVPPELLALLEPIQVDFACLSTLSIVKLWIFFFSHTFQRAKIYFINLLI